MMQLLLPLGLLGLLGVLALIIIYIVRPNYETRHINSTYVWKLSLKYKKRKLPTSKIRNLLIFLCQILILVSMASILTKPAIVYEDVGDENELIAVIDSSMSMYTKGADDITRFDRAIDMAISECNATIGRGGRVSVILADGDPSYLRQRVTVAGQADLIDALLDLKMDENGRGSGCSYDASDLDAAMELSEEVLSDNPYARINVYTDKTFQYVPSKVSVISARGDNEWNVGILNATAQLEDGYYELTVQMACYGMSRDIELCAQVYGANAANADSAQGSVGGTVLRQNVFCHDGEVMTVVFRYGGGANTDNTIYYPDLGVNDRFFSFSSIAVYVDEDDNLKEDNNFYIYGGLKEVVKVQYASGKGSGTSVGPNPFVNGVLPVIKDALSDRWDIQVTEVKQGAEAATEGFDVYIFEHDMPQALPRDGVVILFDPLTAPMGSDISLAQSYTSRQLVPLSADMADHPLMRNIDAGNIGVTEFKAVNHSSDYDVLMTCNGIPVFLARNDQDIKTAILTFSVHNSNLVMQPEWVLLMYNLFDYFLPSTVEKNSFSINEEIKVNGRGPRVTFTPLNGDEAVEYEEFPVSLSIETPGSYQFDVTTYFNKRAQTEYIFVRPPEEESNINAVDEAIEDPYSVEETYSSYDDLLVWFAAALVALLFIEWALHSLEKS